MGDGIIQVCVGRVTGSLTVGCKRISKIFSLSLWWTVGSCHLNNTEGKHCITAFGLSHYVQ